MLPNELFSLNKEAQKRTLEEYIVIILNLVRPALMEKLDLFRLLTFDRFKAVLNKK